MRAFFLLSAVCLTACHLIGGVHDAPISDDAAGGSAATGATGGTMSTSSGQTIPTGLPCDPNVPCTSGHCADGVCCATACDGPCEICSDPASGVGTCAPLPAGEPGDCDGGALCSANGSCIACGDSVPPVGGGCPAWCENDCADGVCVRSCDQEQACTQPINCPQGWDCRIECTAKQACQGAEINCPAGERCDVVCTGEQACQETVVLCDGGPCSLDCVSGMQVCEDAEVACGWNACEAKTCGGGIPPQVDCSDACSCTSC